MTTLMNSKPAAAKRPRKMAREPGSVSSTAAEASHALDHKPGTATAPTGPKQTDKLQSKASLVLNLLGRECGSTLEQLVAATGWLPHTTRAALTGIRKKGHDLSSEKVDGVRTYRVTPAEFSQ